MSCLRFWLHHCSLRVVSLTFNVQFTTRKWSGDSALDKWAAARQAAKSHNNDGDDSSLGEHFMPPGVEALSATVARPDNAAAAVQMRAMLGLPAATAKAPASQGFETARVSVCQPARIYFLGTGSSEPSKYRNGSAIWLVSTRAASSLLMDCAEGTWGALCQLVGLVSAAELLTKLECVWLSHHHADHCLGLVEILGL